ncbi:MAG: amino acid permease [Methanomassiliicoccus sp.]|nr:amino acid permease [Methanomassiliicoccus sp.]
MSDKIEKLNLFDVTNIIVGTVLGTGIFITLSLTGSLVGPSSLVVWLIAGIIALIIALSFNYCVMVLPKSGGPYAFAQDTFSSLGAFMVGWSFLLFGWLSLVAITLAFLQYFEALVPDIGFLAGVGVMVSLVVFAVVTNLMGVKVTGRVINVLSLAKIVPFALLVVGGAIYLLGEPERMMSNFTPFLTGSAINFGEAVVVAFWAYTGFELATLPAGEVEEPTRTIPRAIIIGMLVVASFYFFINLVVFGALGGAGVSDAGNPLAEASKVIFAWSPELAWLMALLVGIGALLAIACSEETELLGASRLARVLAEEGMMPRALAKLSVRSGVPWVSIVLLATTALAATFLGGLESIINASVFMLAFVYLMTCLTAAIFFAQGRACAKATRFGGTMPVLGVAFSLLIMTYVNPPDILLAALLMAVGGLAYILVSRRYSLSGRT